MFLFDASKGTIHKITNGVLLVWLIGAIVFFCSSIIQIVVEKPVYTYEEYKTSNCNYYLIAEETAVSEKEYCEQLYQNHLLGLKDEDYYNKITLYTSLANVLIVGFTVYIINKKKSEKGI